MRIHPIALCALILATPFGKTYGLTHAEIRDISTSEPEQAIKTLTGILQKDPKDSSALFLLGVELRSGFEVKESSKVFGTLIAKDPNSPDGLAAACILGVDLSKDAASALYYYNGLLALADQHPDSIAMNWSAAILARALTRYTLEYNLWDEVRNRILLAGVRYYQRVMNLMAPSEGPYILHLTYGNLLDELEAHDQALVERKTALRLSRFGENLHAIARTYYQLGEYEQATPFIKEAIEMEPKTAKYYGQYAEILQRQGAYREAIQKAEIEASIRPQSDEAMKQCMFLARDLGDVKSAYAYSQQQVERYPQDDVSRVWNARFAAMNGVPNASQLIKEAGSLNCFNKRIPDEDLGTKEANYPWWNAVAYGDAVALKPMISPETLAKRTSTYSQTALMIAARNGYEQMASDLIKGGAEIDAVDVNKDTALHYASQFKNPRLVELLLEAGANPNLKDKFGETPLVKCTCNIDRQGLVALLSHKADPSIAQPRWGAPILFAAGHGDIDAIRLLLAHGATVESRDRSGATPLIVSVKYHNRFAHPWIVNPLLQAGADIHAKDNDGRTALHHVINPQLNIPSIDVLLEKGAEPAVPDNFGTTPITQARALGFEDIAKKLESKAGKAEQFVFPKFAAPDPSLTTDEVRATYFVVPILMAQGHPLGRLTGLAPNDKGAARDELKNMFGIDSAKSLKDELNSMETFQPSLRDDAGDLPLPEGKGYSTLFKSAVGKIHQSENPAGIDETAWLKSHIMYLADLGVTAGYLKQEEASPLINAASADLAKKYRSWKDYLASFLLGAKLHNGWEYSRYKNISDLISSTAPAWM